jgi:hypothetical protein
MNLEHPLSRHCATKHCLRQFIEGSRFPHKKAMSPNQVMHACRYGRVVDCL